MRERYIKQKRAQRYSRAKQKAQRYIKQRKQQRESKAKQRAEITSRAKKRAGREQDRNSTEIYQGKENSRQTERDIEQHRDKDTHRKESST